MPTLTLVDGATGRKLELWDGSETMRTLADALAKLRELEALGEDGRVEIRTVPMCLPDGTRSAIVSVVEAQHRSGWGVAMPCAAHFDATVTRGQRQRYAIARLNGAIADADGNVQLLDGSYLHNVELEPTKLHYQLTSTQQRILHHAICFLEAEDRCYRSVHHKLLPKLRALDYYAIGELGRGRGAALKAIEGYVIDKMPGVSRQTIANALAYAGLRRPRSGRRAA